MNGFLYSEAYLKTYRRYRDIMNTEIVITISKIPSQTEDPIFKIKALPRSRVFINEIGKETNASSVILFIDELQVLKSINMGGAESFPIKDVRNRVKIVRINGFSYTIDSKNINFFNNVIRFDLVSTT